MTIDYLTLLKAEREKNIPYAGTAKTAQTPAPDFLQFVQSRHRGEKVAFSSGATATHYRWRIQFPSQPAMEVCFSPGRDEREVREQYHDATIVEPLPEAPVPADPPAAPDDATLPPAADDRRQRILALLERHPGYQRAVVADVAGDPDGVILTVGVRGLATGDLVIPAANYDPLALMQLMDEYAGEARNGD